MLLRFLRFNAVGALGIGVQLTVLWVLVDVVGVGYLPATLIAVSSAVVHNFMWHQRWTWADRSSRGRRAIDGFLRFVLANGTVSLVGGIIVMALLVDGAGLHALLANLVAIVVCGLANFVLGDKLVFIEREPVIQP